MNNSSFKLITPIEAEEIFGEKYFYRQRTYRLASAGKIPELNLKGNTCFLGDHILRAYLSELEDRVKSRFPELDSKTINIYYDVVNGKRVVVDGIFGKGVSVKTDEESEEDLLKKISGILEWISSEEKNESGHLDMAVTDSHEEQLGDILPEEIMWVRVNSENIESVSVKSLILVSLPSVSQFIGIRPDAFTQWISQTTFVDNLLSAHYKQLQETGIPVSWKRGVTKGLTPFIPFELLPEILVAFRQSGRTIVYQEKSEQLYSLAKTTLEAVGLAVSGNKDRAAEELAKVGLGLGLTAADQIIGVFKQYEARDFQVQTTKEFQSKVKDLKMNYAVTIGTMTLGITNKMPGHWRALGASRKLPKKIWSSGREVMRQLSPADGVGMTFGEKHFTKDPNIDEAIETGKQGKDFYQRLKKVGLLDN